MSTGSDDNIHDGESDDQNDICHLPAQNRNNELDRLLGTYIKESNVHNVNLSFQTGGNLKVSAQQPASTTIQMHYHTSYFIPTAQPVVPHVVFILRANHGGAYYNARYCWVAFAYSATIRFFGGWYNCSWIFSGSTNRLSTRP